MKAVLSILLTAFALLFLRNQLVALSATNQVYAFESGFNQPDKNHPSALNYNKGKTHSRNNLPADAESYPNGSRDEEEIDNTGRNTFDPSCWLPACTPLNTGANKNAGGSAASHYLLTDRYLAICSFLI
ncbi:MAG TPA: hypothetical protein PLQ32_02810 [Flavihumibacter sp.]|nr:hypothetical protein [Flavihumibacter sp.]